ncbi:trans-sulfuration enzyme family protein [Georgenia sp. Z1491]|uniref:trans-sulfuration enzyme family protein n=1 Tax=Georgenia sp. Z1491 TaxID=3416707 RepID=UPI003CFADB5D
MNENWSARTRAVALGRPAGPGAPLNVPPSLASTLREGGTDYTRFGTDGTTALEAALGSLDGGHAVAFSSGMGAAAAIVETMPVGTHVVSSSTIYHGVRSLLADLTALGRLRDVPVDATDHDAVAAALDAAAAEGVPALLWLETPSNPLLEILDVEALAAIAAERGVPVAVDSTFATPLRLRPLELGATYVVHSATKYIGGHSDLLMGVVVARDPDALAPIVRQRSLHGGFPGGMETFLALRGLRTLAVRLDRAEASAQVLAERLADHPAVTSVAYPGLPDDPGHELAARTMGGFGAVVSFCLRSEDAADRVLARTELVIMATSLGGVETTAERRNRWGEGTRTGLVRMSVGIEDVEDVWADLARALEPEVSAR